MDGTSEIIAVGRLGRGVLPSAIAASLEVPLPALLDALDAMLARGDDQARGAPRKPATCKWSPEEIQELDLLSPLRPAKRIVDLLGRTFNAVNSTRVRLASNAERVRQRGGCVDPPDYKGMGTRRYANRPAVLEAMVRFQPPAPPPPPSPTPPPRSSGPYSIADRLPCPADAARAAARTRGTGIAP